MMEKKAENVSPPPSVGDYDDNQSTYTVDQPPPAYRKPDLASVKMTKIVAATVLIVTLIAGITAVAIVYIQHNLKCAHYEAIQQESARGASPEAAKIVQDQLSGTTTTSDDQKTALPDIITAEAQDQLKKLSFPIHIDMDELTGRMMEKNQRARLNCVIEKKKTEEIIPRAPKTLQTPFGNLTTDPKFTHVTGETMSLTCRSGNERVSRPVTEKSAPILIQIPIQRGPPLPPQQLQQQDRPSSPVQGPGRLVDPRVQPPPMLPMPQHLQQQQQGAPSHQLPLQGPPLPAHQPPSLFPVPQPEQSQPRLLNNPFGQLRLPFMPFPQFPQIPLREVIPHLLEVHKQIQQQRQQEEEQQQQQHQQRRNKAQHQQEDSDESNEEQHQGAMRDNSQEQQQQQQQQQQGERSRGRAINMHDMPLNRLIPGPPHPFMQQPHPNMPPPQHLRGPEPMMMHHEKQMEQQQQQQRRMQQEQQQQQQQQQRHHQQEQQQQQSQEEEHHEHQHARGPEIRLEGAPSFHNDMPHVVPAEMMERAGPLPFIVGSHNMQPRSSARPRMKRMAGECSCVCK